MRDNFVRRGVGVPAGTSPSSNGRVGYVIVSKVRKGIACSALLSTAAGPAAAAEARPTPT